jgi:hypothetical protein
MLRMTFSSRRNPGEIQKYHRVELCITNEKIRRTGIMGSNEKGSRTASERRRATSQWHDEFAKVDE